jgi:two-component system response regulator AtoC
LLTGASGTGKGAAARTIHTAGRADRPFVAINCGAIPETLLERELFGHVRGAFTGADTTRAGLLEEAGSGTVFLDEIGDLPLSLQVKLNRVLEERQYRRLGETREQPLRARIIAATLKDLTAEVEAGRFRRDLQFRLAVYPIELPALSIRGDDVFLLAQYALQRANQRFGRHLEGFTPEALQILAQHPWPGNVRELVHAVERAAILALDNRIRAIDLPDHLEEPDLPSPTRSQTPLSDMTYKQALAWVRSRGLHQYLDVLLTRFEGNVTEAAEQAGVERESLHRLLRKAGLKAADYRS